ncbi:periplasmic heavy metal sensor [Paraburkholderia sp. PREW-6R]|uniref:periplasmic heavy metal sensor n=1 Tax=Paraburkholderia sp. PREW-6R TaxID=3141544 RepID=UPI0031F55E3D
MNGRSWKFVLAASLVLNVFLVGAIVGGAYQWFSARGITVPLLAQQRALRFAAQPLSAQQQKAFVDGLKNARREGRQFAREAREGRRDVLRLLAAPQFDRGALDAALARTRAADSSLRALVESSVADFAATLTPEERVKFADSLKLRGQWREPAPAANAQKPGNADGNTADGNAANANAADANASGGHASSGSSAE